MWSRRWAAGSSTFTTARLAWEGAKSRTFASRYASIVPWKSRWSCERFVKTATSTIRPSTRCCASACEEISSAAARTCPSRMAANRRWRSGASGVVRDKRHGLASHSGSSCSDNPRLPPRGLEDRLQEIRDRGLPVGTGHPDGDHRRRRVAERERRHRPHRFSDRPHEHLRRVDLEPSLHDERDRPRSHGVRREAMAVRSFSGDAEEQRTWRGLTGVIRDIADQNAGVAVDLGSGDRGRQVFEWNEGEGRCHRPRAYPRPRSRVRSGHGVPSKWGGAGT